MKRLALLFLATLLIVSCSQTISPKLSNLTVEQQDGSRALATATPRFSWNYDTDAENVLQTSYRIIVATTKEKAENNKGNIQKGNTKNQTLPYVGNRIKGWTAAFS